MKAIIFAAGNGTRLRPLTNDTPKPMIKVGGKPVLEHIVDHLNSFGIEDIMINLHYLPEQFYKYFGTRLTYFYEPELLGEENTLHKVHQWLGDPFVVMNGDTLTNIDIKAIIRGHKESGCDVTIFLDGSNNAGTWVYSQSYFTEKTIHINYFEPKKTVWIDIGTHKRLEKARKIWK